MVELICILLVILASAAFAERRLLRYLRFFQQEEYDRRRLLAWISANRAFDSRGTLVAALAAFVHGSLIVFGYLSADSQLIFSALFAGVLVLIVSVEEDPRKAGKIKLKMTERASRLYESALVLYLAALLLAGAGSFAFLGRGGPTVFWLTQLVFFQAVPLFLVLAGLILQPGENRLQLKFLDEARRMRTAVAPYIIGITGSYGKTSTKAILGKLLEVTLGPTFWPQQGINTLMGITREVREKLRPGHKYAVVEMGAYREGSIRKLCQLMPPDAAIITAVGLMHLERFGGAENIYRAKSELAQELPENGLLVCNGDNPGARRIAAEFPKARTILYGLNPQDGKLDVWMSDIEFTSEGSKFVIYWQHSALPGFTPLHGKPVLSNVLGAFTMACALGADPSFTLGALRNLEPVSNRLQVVKMGSYIQINDAYNSNPVGFAAALEVLGALPGKRRILVTPGMIELGEEQDAENEAAAAKAAQVCHLVLVVGKVNRDSLERGLLKGGLGREKIQFFDYRDEALAELKNITRAEDVILLENDLPDLYEIDARF